MVHTIRCHWLSGTTLASINNLESEPAHSGEWFRVSCRPVYPAGVTSGVEGGRKTSISLHQALAWHG